MWYERTCSSDSAWRLGESKRGTLGFMVVRVQMKSQLLIFQEVESLHRATLIWNCVTLNAQHTFEDLLTAFLEDDLGQFHQRFDIRFVD